jgi:hypothetical protein
MGTVRCEMLNYILLCRCKVTLNFALEQAVKTQSRSAVIVLLFL